MNKARCIISVILVISVVLQSMFFSPLVTAESGDFPANPLDKPGWILERNDEFNGTELDTSLWIPSYLSYRTTSDRSAARYSFRDGSLVLRIDPDQPTYYASGSSMKVSSIQTGQRDNLHGTTFSQSMPTIMNYTPKQGYFEIRAKTVNQSGYHCAFWTLGIKDEPWKNAEIDIMEQFGGSRSNYMNLHRWDDTTLSESSSSMTFSFDPSTEYHIYALEWDETSIKFYVDNQLKRTVNQSPSYEAIFLLSIYENAGWTGTPDTNADLYPREFVIDYFRAYKKDTSSIESTKYEAESLTRSASTGVTTEVWNDGASGGGWVKANSTTVDQYIDFTVNVPTAGPYVVKTGYRTGSIRGIAQLSINGQNHGSSIDMYQATATFNDATTGIINFSTPGVKTFRYKVTGKNASSTNYGLGIDYIELMPQSSSVKYEAESLTRSTSTGVTTEVWNDGASGGGWVKANSTTVDQYIDFTVNVPTAGPYVVKTGYRTGSIRGIAQLSINGQNHGSSIDMYQATATFNDATTGIINFSTPGVKTFRYKVTGKNASSTNYGLGIDYIELIPQN